MPTPRHPNLHSSKLRNELWLSMLVLAVLAALPLVVHSNYWLGVLIVSMYFAMMSCGWNLLAGYTGQFSLAPAAFAMLGGYATGLFSHHLNAPLWVGLPMAIVIPGLIGLVLGRIVLRLSGAYLALTTLSFAEILRLVIYNSIDFTRGDQGLNVPSLTDSRLAYYYIFLAALVLAVAIVYYVLRRPAGRFLQAIRDDEIGAASRGIDVVRYKTLAFLISCAICGFAGGLYGTFARLVSPELGLIAQTGLVIAMVVIGGMGTLVGPLIGAMLVYTASEILRDVGGIQMIVFSLLVIVFARFFREGLWGLLRRFLGRHAATERKTV
ncbi:branched-chain amino acid ABC transporter permease [Parapusillimonas granuli]|uniref:Branched-chain amino acid ABC transporter permease n=1 Tax=Parapusillimonas granuli TaxID=380911 RepID=A0A853G3I8_9BURK|nr:branched-chain amino acid ABC transporter permease [Parapusillimonas granuli]MBB5215915.1 branched-chain amino acid transport system permease protein [Parapusillimonas granuli]MEB2399394.1 branched-chain amino acid ABC transporter permease [Alcaligenaceae bacterium]NYT50787.1 branched-chain amino acid ABC transporter permease [Parapusillimonas granuli]